MTDRAISVNKGRERMKRRTPDGNILEAANRAVAEALRRDRPLRKFLLALSKIMSGAGGSVFLAGGYLRDVAEGKPGADVDVMVAGLTHRELGRRLRSLPHARLGIRKVIPAGKHFPVYRVAASWRDGYIDVSVDRGGGGRMRSSLARALEDAARRDFTVNSLLYEISQEGNRRVGRLLDPFGGVRDLAGCVIRCVGNAEDRLREDPIRAQRALRMKNERRRHRIEPATCRAVKRLGPALLPGVSADRLVGELLRSLAANPEGTLEDLRRYGILRALLPELSRRKGGVSRAGRRYRSLARSSRGPIPETILLANLLADLSPRDAETVARRLRFPNVRRVLRALSDLRAMRHPGAMRFPGAETEAILSRQEGAEPFLALHHAATASDGSPGRKLKHFFAYCSKTPFLIRGTELSEMGFPEGPGREEALLAVREATLNGKVRTREEAMRFAENIRAAGTKKRTAL